MWATFVTGATLHEVFVQVFLRFSDSIKSSQYVHKQWLDYELAELAGIGKSKENLQKSFAIWHIDWDQDAGS